MGHKRGLSMWLLFCLLVEVNAGTFMLVADLDNATIYTGSISQRLGDLAPLPLIGVVRPVAVDYDPVDEMVYWTDVGLPSPKISRARLDGSNQRTLIYDLDLPGGLALDVVSRMVYWIDEALGYIARIPMDGSADKEILVENLDQPRSIVTHHTYGYIYWTDLENNGTIERADLDGRNRQVIVQENMVLPTGIAIDYEENHLYWCDFSLETIEQSDLSGNNRRVVIDLTPFNGTFGPFDLAVYNDNVYWTDWGTYSILRVSTSGRGEQLFGPNAFEKAGGIHIHEEVNYCDSYPCAAHGESCIDVINGYLCQCTGDTCFEYPCDSSPCMNRGSCTEASAGGFTCECAPGYAGVTCDQVRGCVITNDIVGVVVDPYQLVYLPGERVDFSCASGYDFRGISVWFCRSDFTWTANQAECIAEVQGCDINDYIGIADALRVDRYQSVYLPGENVEFSCVSGFEFRGDSVWTCRSDLTWSSRRAECIREDPCDSSPCMNRGSCTVVSGGGGFTCRCAPGYGGVTCDEVGGCVLTRGPSDVVRVDPYQLVYLPGQRVEFKCPDDFEFTGSSVWFCRSDFTWSEDQAECTPEDPCDSSPCMNRGSCTAVSGGGGFTCRCAPGYGGVTCDEENDIPLGAIIGGAGGATLVIIALLVILIVVKRRRTKNREDRVIQVPQMSTIFSGQNQHTPNDPPAYTGGRVVYQDSLYSDLRELGAQAPSHQARPTNQFHMDHNYEMVKVPL